MNNIQSEPIESLRLVSDQTFNFAQECMQRNIQSKFPEQRRGELDEIPIDAKTKASVYGASLLSGLLYCAYCGHRLVGTYCQENRKGVMRHRAVYRDFVNPVRAKHCEGQAVYSAKSTEPSGLVLHSLRASEFYSIHGLTFREEPSKSGMDRGFFPLSMPFMLYPIVL